MPPDLRPSSLGEILDRTAQMYRKHFLPYFGIAAVSYSGILVLSLLGSLLLFSHAQDPTPHGKAGVVTGLGVLSICVGLLSILPVAVAMAAVMHSVARNYLGQPCTIAEAYKAVGRRWYRYVLILLSIYCYGFLPPVFVGGAIITAGLLMPIGLGRGIVIGLGIIVVFCAFFVALWWMLRWALSVPASLMENLTVHRALKRSAVLTRGAVGRIFVMLLLVVAVMTVIQYAVQIPMFFLLWKSKGVPTLTTQIATLLGSSITGTFVLPIYSIALTLFYYDQRIRKEGYDVEWLMEQAALPHALSEPGNLHGALTPQTEPPISGSAISG
jgi:hypothetical protein